VECSREHENKPSGYINVGKFLSTAQLATSQEGFSSMKLVIYVHGFFQSPYCLCNSSCGIIYVLWLCSE
jgi:hypothetical protein